MNIRKKQKKRHLQKKGGTTKESNNIWEEHISTKRKMSYWFNINNGETSWEKPNIKDNKKKIAFCFLTYGNIIHKKEWNPYFEDNNVYIHPKFPDNVSSEYKKYIIPQLTETSWGNESIVYATISLLKNAFKSIENEWFILCSEDSCPLKTYKIFFDFLKTQDNSIFDVMDEKNNKTSQWWLLCRKDVKLLLINESSFGSIIKNIPPKQAVDELFFLTALKMFNNSYNYKKGCIHYVKWFSEWISKHPTIFNKLLEEDINSINDNSCWFIRKTFPTFKNELITKKPTCIIMCIGSESINEYSSFLNYTKDKANIFLLVMVSSIENTDLRHNCEQAYYVVWNMVDKAANVLYNKFKLNYDEIFVLKEKFNYKIIDYPLKNKSDKWSFFRHNENVMDFNNSTVFQSFYKKKENIKTELEENLPIITLEQYNKNYKVAFLFLVIEDINHPEIWDNYFNNNMDNVSIYCHSKYPEKTKTPWLKNNMIKNLRPTGWGYIVDAYLSILNVATSDKNNMKFVVISESCLPIYNFNKFNDMLKKDDYRTSYIHFMKLSSYDIDERIKTQAGHEKIGVFIKHYARFCLSRYHVEKLLNISENSKQFFIKMHVGDEFFLTLINAKENRDYIKNFTITYDNWEDVHEEVKSVKNKIQTIENTYKYLNEQQLDESKKEAADLKKYLDNLRKNPKTYNTVTENDIKRALNSGSFFWRKFPAKLNMNDYYNKKGDLRIKMWEEHMSTKYNRPYWVNLKTGISVWEKPEDMNGGINKKNVKIKNIKKTFKKRIRNKRKTKKNYRIE